MKLDSAIVASPSASSCQKSRSIRGNFESPSATDTLVLPSCDDKKDENDHDIDTAAALVETEPQSLKCDYFELDKASSKDEEDRLLSVSALKYTSRSLTESKGTKGADMRHTISKRTDALQSNIGMDRIWLSNGISRPKYDTKHQSSVLKEPKSQHPHIEQAEWLDACIEECTRRVNAMIVEGIGAIAAQTSHHEELVFELDSGEMPDDDGLYASTALYHERTSTQSKLIQDIEGLLE